ncbi:MAG: hypothetical protein WBA00_07010 [Rhodococcus sp. (in: high G+C Gram-positive bacteria)]
MDDNDTRDDNTREDNTRATRRVPSVGLLLAGLAALTLAVPTIVGVDATVLFATLFSGWVLLAVAVIVGLILIVGPVGRRRSRS